MKKENVLRFRLGLFCCILLALHPLMELDYLLPENALPRLSTIVNFLLFPFLGIATFWYLEKDKCKRILIFLALAIPFSVYFVIHCLHANKLQYQIHLPNNFIFLWRDEVIYTFTLLLPLVYIYVFYRQEIKESFLKKVVVTSSLVTALPIVVANIFVVGRSTYQGYTQANFFSWFSLPFDNELHHPRLYAGKFFFEEGNTMGVLMLMVLPLLYYFFYVSTKKKEKLALAILIGIHSLAMIILSTRVAAYGALLVPLAVFFIWLVLLLLRQAFFQASFLALLIVISALGATIIPFSPAYQNQLIDAQDYEFIKNDEDKRSAGLAVRRGGEGLQPYSKEWLDFYTYMFEDYAFLMNVTPPVYYTEWYDYHHDPKFWVDVIFDYELEERVSGRQIENIFTHYKYDPLPLSQKIWGLGFGTFMRGSILIEQDFKQQYYSYGILGFLFVQFPWILIFSYIGGKLLFGDRRKKWNFFNVLLALSCAMTFLASYVSGHVLDELSTSMMLALFLAILARRCWREE